MRPGEGTRLGDCVEQWAKQSLVCLRNSAPTWFQVRGEHSKMVLGEEELKCRGEKLNRILRRNGKQIAGFLARTLCLWDIFLKAAAAAGGVVR